MTSRQKQTNAPDASLSETLTELRGDRIEVKLAIFRFDNVEDGEQHSNLGVASVVPVVARHDGDEGQKRRLGQ